MNKSRLLGSVGALTVALATSASAATLLNLTTEVFDGVAPADSGVANGALFQVTFQQPTGTGVIDPFLRLQGNGQKPEVEGMNTSANNVLDNKAGKWTHDLQLGDLGVSNGYYQFLLDINEANQTKSLLSLDRLTLSTAATGGLTYDEVKDPSIATLRYDLDIPEDFSILLDAARNHGSGSGDLLINIPTSLFAGVAPENFLYLYAAFGSDPSGTGQTSPQATGGFEEFAVIRAITTTPIPEPGSALIGMLVVGLAATRFGARSRPQP